MKGYAIEKILQWDIEHFWHPYTQMRWYRKVRPPIIVRASGNYLFDINGEKYLDAVSSIWCIAFGHSEKRILNTIIKQARVLQHSTTLGMSNIPAILLTRKLKEVVGLPKVFLSEDGAEAVEIAVKMCFSYSKRTGKKKKVKFCTVKNAYHGDTIGAMSVSGETVFTSEYKELMFDVIELPPVYCFRCPFNKSREKGVTRCSYECVEGAVKILRSYKDKICAVFVEGGVQGAGGIIPFPKGYLKTLWEESRRHDILFVSDEVATGFGRTGKMFGFEGELGRNKPDIVCLGKALSGGYLPVAATVVSDKIYNVFDGELWEYKHFFHGHTFTGNPIACASAVENINIFQEKNIIEKIQPTIRYLEKRIRELIDLENVGDVRGRGFMWGVELVRRGKESFPRRLMVGWRVALDMWKKGIFIRPLGDVIVINPPLSIKQKEIDFIVDELRDSVLKLKSST